jgi:hypothetical protein
VFREMSEEEVEEEFSDTAGEDGDPPAAEWGGGSQQNHLIDSTLTELGLAITNVQMMNKHYGTILLPPSCSCQEPFTLHGIQGLLCEYSNVTSRTGCAPTALLNKSTRNLL